MEVTTFVMADVAIRQWFIEEFGKRFFTSNPLPNVPRTISSRIPSIKTVRFAPVAFVKFLAN